MMLLWFIRFFVFTLYESPKYLMGRGRDQDAVDVIHKVAEYNGVNSSLTLDQLQRAGQTEGHENLGPNETSALASVKRSFSHFNFDHLKALFATRKLAWSTTLLIIIWSLIGCAFPLYNSFVTYL